MIRFALLGAGRIANVHAENIAEMANAQLAAIHDPADEKARALADKWGADTAPNLEALLQRPDIDAVIVASATNTHGMLTKEAARAGKAVYCEKPLDTDLPRARAAVAAVADSGVPAMTGFHRRFMPQYAALKDEISRGVVGRIKTISIISREPNLHPFPYLQASGGMYRDRGVHMFDIIRWLSGLEPVEVHAMGTALEEPALLDISDQDTALMSLRMEDGSLCHIELARLCCYGWDERIEVFGTAGMIEAGRAGHHHVTPGLIRFMPGKSIYDGLPGHGIFSDNFKHALRSFVDALEQGRAPEPSLAAGLKAQIVAEAAARSHELSQPVLIADL